MKRKLALVGKIAFCFLAVFAFQRSVFARSGRTSRKTGENGSVKEAKSPRHGQQFFYYAPSSYNPKKPMPFVLSYHGASGTGSGEIKSWTKLADEKGFIVACPTSKLAGAGKKAGVAVRMNVKEFFRETEIIHSIVKFMKEKYNLDERFMMITGFSGGGIPTFWYGFTQPAVFRFVCPRSGNFPPLLPIIYQKDEKGKAVIDATVQNNYILYFYGSNDHKIILGNAPKVTAWIQGLDPKYFEKRQIQGMGHQSKPDVAAEWFFSKMDEAGKRWEKQALEQYKKLIEKATEAGREDDYGTAFKMYSQAAKLEKYYPRLGSKGERWIKRISGKAKRLLRKAQVKLKSPRPESRDGAVGVLKELVEKYAGTEQAKEGLAMLKKIAPEALEKKEEDPDTAAENKPEKKEPEKKGPGKKEPAENDKKGPMFSFI